MLRTLHIIFLMPAIFYYAAIITPFRWLIFRCYAIITPFIILRFTLCWCHYYIIFIIIRLFSFDIWYLFIWCHYATLVCRQCADISFFSFSAGCFLVFFFRQLASRCSQLRLCRQHADAILAYADAMAAVYCFSAIDCSQLFFFFFRRCISFHYWAA